MARTIITPKDKLTADLRVVIDDTEELLKATAGQAGDKVNAVRARMEHSLSAAKARVVELEHAMEENAMAAVKATDIYVHENPWQIIGVAAGIAFIFGWMCRRK